MLAVFPVQAGLPDARDRQGEANLNEGCYPGSVVESWLSSFYGRYCGDSKERLHVPCSYSDARRCTLFRHGREGSNWNFLAFRCSSPNQWHCGARHRRVSHFLSSRGFGPLTPRLNRLFSSPSRQHGTTFLALKKELPLRTSSSYFHGGGIPATATRPRASGSCRRRHSRVVCWPPRVHVGAELSS